MNAAPAASLTEVLARHTPALMATEGVVGTAESQLDDGRPCILVLVKTAADRGRIPSQLEGWPVKVQVTGEIRALPDSAR